MEEEKIERKKFLVKKIEKDKEYIHKDTLLLGASALAVGIGILGCSLLLESTIHPFKDIENIDFGDYMLINFKSLGFSVSILTILGGIYTAINNCKNMIFNFKNFKKDKIELKEYDEPELKRERKK